MTSMRVISLSQPWLWSILDLPEPHAKRVENRTWQPPIEMIGKRIALHAAKSWDGNAITRFISYGLRGFPDDKREAQSGVIVGVATIDRIITSDRTLPELQRRWFFGPYGWVLTDVRRLLKPIPWRGVQGLRTLPPEIATEIENQLDEDAAEALAARGP